MFVYKPVILGVIARQHMFFDEGDLCWADFSISPSCLIATYETDNITALSMGHFGWHDDTYVSTLK